MQNNVYGHYPTFMQQISGIAWGNAAFLPLVQVCVILVSDRLGFSSSSPNSYMDIYRSITQVINDHGTHNIQAS